MRNYKLTFDMNTQIRNFNKKKEADYFIQNNFKLILQQIKKSNKVEEQQQNVKKNSLRPCYW